MKNNLKKNYTLLVEKLDLIVLPYELEKLERNKKYSIKKIYNRLYDLGKLMPFETYPKFLETCKQYERMHLGFKVVDNEYLVKTDKKTYNPKTKSYE